MKQFGETPCNTSHTQIHSCLFGDLAYELGSARLQARARATPTHAKASASLPRSRVLKILDHPLQLLASPVDFALAAVSRTDGAFFLGSSNRKITAPHGLAGKLAGFPSV